MVAADLIVLGTARPGCYNPGSRSDDQSAAGHFCLVRRPLLRLSHLADHHAGSFLLARKVLLRARFGFRVSPVSMRLYVGNLSYNTTSQALEEMFAEFGQVKSAQVVQDRDTGRSKGFGFVEMNDAGQAKAAIEALNSKEVDGRALTVNEARPREERSFGGGGGGGRGGYGGGRGGSGGGGGGYGGGGGGRRY